MTSLTLLLPGRCEAQQRFAVSLVNGIEVYRDANPRSRIFGNREFLTSASLCAEWSENKARLEQLLISESAAINSKLPSGVSIVRQSAQLSQNCAAVANYAAGRINLNIKLPDNVFTFNVTTPGPLPQDFDPRASIHFDVGVSAQIQIPSIPRDGLNVGPVQLQLTNVKPVGENITGDIAIAVTKLISAITGEDFLGQLTRDRILEFAGVRRLVVPINSELAAQLPILEHSYDPATRIVVIRGPTTGEVSFRSLNFQDRYVRHKNSLGFVDPVPFGDALGEKDASFRIVPGLAGRCSSFESDNYPNHFLRHQNSRIKLAERNEDQLFLEDATFCIVRGLAGSGISFQSANYQDRYIRHRNFELWLDTFADNDLFKKDASFEVMTPPLILRRSIVR